LIRGSPVPQLFVPRKTLRNNSRVIKKQPQFPIFNSPVPYLNRQTHDWL